MEMRDGNIRLILRTMLKSGPISRVDISRKTGLTPSAVSVLTRYLLDEGIVEELGPDTDNMSVGRPPSLLRLASRSYAAVGAEIGVNHLTIGIISWTGAILQKERKICCAPRDLQATFAEIGSFYRTQEKRLSSEGIAIAGLGVGVTGLVDIQTGINRFAPNLGWRDVNVKGILTEELGVPILVDNNVRLMALGEEWFGAARNSGSLVFVQVGHGVGCGMVLPGIGPLRGTFNGGGELGHCTVLPGGPQCRCGKRGCLEALVSESAIVSSYLQRIAVRRYPPGYVDNLTVDAIVERAIRGDQTAEMVLKEAASYLGIGLATMVNIFEPRQIVLNGNALVLSPYTQKWIKESTREHSFSKVDVQFSTAAFRNYQGMLGAATAVLKEQIF